MASKDLPKKLRRWIAPAIVVAACLSLARAGQASAAGSLTVAPAFVRVSISQAQPVQDLSVSVRNDYAAPIAIEAAVSAVDQSGGQLVPVSGDGDGLVPALTLSQTNIQLEPGKSANVNIRITNSDALAPGGHYAALIIRQATEAGPQVPLEPAVSVALFIVKEDGAVRDVGVALPRLSGLSFSLPKSADLTFTTKGNVDVVPHASISVVRSTNTNVFSHGVVNDASAPLFPGKELKLRTDLVPVKAARWPGKYAMLVRYRYEGQASAQEAAVWFWYIPVWFIAALLACLALSVFVIRLMLKNGVPAWLRRRKKSRKKQIAQPVASQPQIPVSRPKKVLDVMGPSGVLQRPGKTTTARPKAATPPAQPQPAKARANAAGMATDTADEPLNATPIVKKRAAKDAKNDTA